MSLGYWINSIHQKTKVFSLQRKNVLWFSLLVITLTLSQYLYAFPSNYYFHLLIVGYFIVGLFVPKLVAPALYVWMWIGHLLGEVSSTVLLAVVYFLLLLPIRFLSKKQSYAHGWKEKKSYSPQDSMY